ncbi:hypothetical protein Btru_054034 [Bulinus truncatus]|nr:hypothetical protein Btru_054034 [Bulinus truncatus]
MNFQLNDIKQYKDIACVKCKRNWRFNFDLRMSIQESQETRIMSMMRDLTDHEQNVIDLNLERKKRRLQMLTGEMRPNLTG